MNILDLNLKRMENEYYIPAIEEFHVGFEYEAKPKGSEFVEYQRFILHKGLSLEMLFHTSSIRVKYLDRKDIEELNFELKDIISEDRNIYQSKKDCFLRLSCTYKKDIPYISVYHYEGWETPDFIIKNKSELKRLLTQIGKDENREPRLDAGVL